jgi:hypothetical protein
MLFLVLNKDKAADCTKSCGSFEQSPTLIINCNTK